MTSSFSPDIGRIAPRWIGLLLVLLSITLPALPGPLFAQPPIPFAAMWAAYAWAGRDAPGWGAPLALTLFGLAHDLMSGGPFGLFVIAYLATFLVARVTRSLVSAQTLISLWGGFIATSVVLIVIMTIVGRLSLGPGLDIWLFAAAEAVTALLYPLVRGLYGDGEGARS